MKTNQVEVVVFNAKALEVSYVADIYLIKGQTRKRIHCGSSGSISFSEALEYGYNWCKENLCPECGSNNVVQGNSLLSCNDCDWYYLNKYPCTVCGKPSFSAASTGKRHAYGCKEHSATEQLMPGVFKQSRNSS